MSQQNQQSHEQRFAVSITDNLRKMYNYKQYSMKNIELKRRKLVIL